MDNTEKRLTALETARKDLEDAMVVMAHLEKGQSARLKEHAEFIANHETAMANHEAWLKRHDVVMSEIEDKLNGLIGYMDGRQHPPQ
jgi:flagellar basal body rod protein FlgC